MYIVYYYFIESFIINHLYIDMSILVYMYLFINNTSLSLYIYIYIYIYINIKNNKIEKYKCIAM